MLARSTLDASLLSRRTLYRRYELVPGSPVTESRADTGMTVGQLCEAVLQSDDKSAANLLMRVLGGPQAVTAFARDSGDASCLDRWEPALNTAAPGDERDTSTPLAMAEALRRLLLGDVLHAPERTQLTKWMLGNTSGFAGIRAGVPSDWRVASMGGRAATGRRPTSPCCGRRRVHRS